MLSKKWKSFINADRDQLGTWVGETLTELGSEYETSHGSPAFVYDGSETVIFDISAPLQIKIRLIKAVADPITRFFMGLIGGAHKKPATLIEVYDLSKENVGQVNDFISSFL